MFIPLSYMPCTLRFGRYHHESVVRSRQVHLYYHNVPCSIRGGGFASVVGASMATVIAGSVPSL